MKDHATRGHDDHSLNTREMLTYADILGQNYNPSNHQPSTINHQPSLSILERIEKDNSEVEVRRKRLSDLLKGLEGLILKKSSITINPELVDLSREMSSGITDRRVSYLRSVFEYEPEKYLENLLIAHSINVALLSIVIGSGMEYDEEGLFHIFMAGIFHDIGMLRINPKIINKPSELNLHEKKLLSVHPIEGARLFEQASRSTDGLIPNPDLISKIISQEHERVNEGGGYPYKLKEGELHPFAMILGISDTFESLTHPRPYREQMAPHQAFKKLFMNEEERCLFTRGIRKACFTNITPYPPGTYVDLDTGDRAMVIDVEPKYPLNPVILIRRIGRDNMKVYRNVVDLKRNSRIHVNNNGIRK